MKNIILTSLLVLASSSAFAGGGSVGSDELIANKPYYICDLERKETYAKPDAEVLIQFDAKGRIGVKGESAGTCIGSANFLGGDVSKYGAAFEYLSGQPQNENCAYAGVYWYTTPGQGYAALDTRFKVTLKTQYSWAEYRCK